MTTKKLHFFSLKIGSNVFAIIEAANKTQVRDRAEILSRHHKIDIPKNVQIKRMARKRVCGPATYYDENFHFIEEFEAQVDAACFSL